MALRVDPSTWPATSPCAPLSGPRSQGWHPNPKTPHRPAQRLQEASGPLSGRHNSWRPHTWSRPLDQVAIVLFTCQRHPGGLRLTPQACARQWQAGKSALPWDRLYPCRGCAIGAGHAGEAVPDLGDDDPHRCLYCGRRNLRLVSKLICISCANRVFELLRGRFRRNEPPGIRHRLRCYLVDVEDPE